jgi:hypothetical protein
MTARDLSTGLRWTKCSSASNLDGEMVYICEMVRGWGIGRYIGKGGF